MEKINNFDLTCITVNIICVKFILSFPRKIMIIGGSASWIVGLYSTLCMLILFFLIGKLYDFKKGIFEKCKEKSKTVYSLIVGLIIAFSLTLSLGSMMRIYSESVKIILLHETPVEITTFIIIAVIVFANYCGIMAITKISSLFMPIASFFLMLFALLIIPKFKLNNLFPIMGTGFFNIFIKGFSGISAFSDLIVMYILITKCSNNINVKKCGYTSIIISGGILTLIMLFYSLVCPYPVTDEFLFPIYRMTKLMTMGAFFERFEALFEFIWTISILMYFSVYVYAICISWKEAFSLKYHKPLIMPIAIIVALLSLSPTSYLALNEKYLVYCIITGAVSIVIPILINIGKRRTE